MTPPAETIEEVIEQLTRIVEESKSKESRLGYFAALYRQVTITVKRRIDDGDYFDDNERMKRFDVIFANRYLNAISQMQNGSKPPESWAYAFLVSRQWWPITLQHLLLGVNTHINLDLGIAAIESVDSGGLGALRNDFIRINNLLADLVADVKNELASVWSPLRWLNRYLGDIETEIINFSMMKARDAAWAFAEELAQLNVSDRSKAIVRRDTETLNINRAVRHPGFLYNVLTKTIRLGERGPVSRIIGVLAHEAQQWSLSVAAGKRIRKLPPKQI